MRIQDRKLVILYWKLQAKVHTNPCIRAYVCQLSRILKRRHIGAGLVNRVGLEVATEARI